MKDTDPRLLLKLITGGMLEAWEARFLTGTEQHSFHYLTGVYEGVKDRIATANKIFIYGMLILLVSLIVVTLVTNKVGWLYMVLLPLVVGFYLHEWETGRAEKRKHECEMHFSRLRNDIDNLDPLMHTVASRQTPESLGVLLVSYAKRVMETEKKYNTVISHPVGHFDEVYAACQEVKMCKSQFDHLWLAVLTFGATDGDKRLIFAKAKRQFDEESSRS